MKVKKGSILYFAELEYKHLQLLLDNYQEMEDIILIVCHQCIQKYMLRLIKEHYGELLETHNLCILLNKLIPAYPMLTSYRNLCRFLRDCYHDRNYESEDYYELDEAEFEDTVAESIAMIKYLRTRCFEEII